MSMCVSNIHTHTFTQSTSILGSQIRSQKSYEALYLFGMTQTDTMPGQILVDNLELSLIIVRLIQETFRLELKL